MRLISGEKRPDLYDIVVAKSQPGLRDAVQGALETASSRGVRRDHEARELTGGAIDQITINSGR